MFVCQFLCFLKLYTNFHFSQIETGKSHNKSSDDASSYGLEKSSKTYADKNGTMLSSNTNKINNQSR